MSELKTQTWQTHSILMCRRLWAQCRDKARKDGIEWRVWVYNALKAAKDGGK